MGQAMKLRTSLERWGRTAVGVGALALLAQVVLGVRPLESVAATVADGEQLREPVTGLELFTTHITTAQDDTGEIRTVTADIRVPDESGAATTLRSGSTSIVDDHDVRLEGAGIAPRFLVRWPATAPPTTHRVNLRVWTLAHNVDGFRLPEVPATLTARFYPDFTVGPSGPSTASLLLRDPVLHLEVAPDHTGGPIGSAYLRPGDTASFQGLELGVQELGRWATVTITQRRSYAVALLGLLALALGGLAQALARRLGRAPHATRESDAEG